MCHGLRRSHDTRRAFTFVELVIVIAIVGILAVVVVPRFGNSIKRQRADAAARRVATDLVAIQRRANQTSQSLTVSFDAATDSYKVAGVSDLDRPDLEYAVDLAAEPYMAEIDSADFGGSAAITYTGFGDVDTSVSGDGKVVVRVGDELRAVKVNASTGEVSIE